MQVYYVEESLAGLLIFSLAFFCLILLSVILLTLDELSQAVLDWGKMQLKRNYELLSVFGGRISK